MLTNFTTVWCFYNNFYIIIIYLLLSNLHFYFLSSACTASEPGHSRLIDPGPGHKRIGLKVKVHIPLIIPASHDQVQPTELAITELDYFLLESYSAIF